MKNVFSGQICQGMPLLSIFFEEFVQFSGTMTEKMDVKTCLLSELEHKQ